MIMAEVIGVVAAATQLAGVCLGLLDLTRKIKGASPALRDYQVQLQELRNLSEAISQNPLLQTPEVGAHTDSLLAVVNDNNLQPLIARRRFLRTWAFIYKDQELSNIFGALERRKSSLSLVIHNLQAQALHQIQSDIHVMASSQYSNDDSGYDGSQYGGHQPPQNTRPIDQPSTRPTQTSTPMDRPSPATPSNNQTWTTVPPPADNHGPSGASFRYDGRPPGLIQHHLEALVPSTSMEKFREALQKRREILEVMPGSSVVHNCVAFDGGTQHNAPVITGGPEVGNMVNSILSGPPNVLLDCYTVGSGIQHNDLWAEIDGKLEIRAPTGKGHFYSGAAAIPMTLPDGETVAGKQYNSFCIHMREDKENS